MIYSNAGLQKWRVIDDSFPLNRASFLIASMLSLSYVEEVDEKGKLLCLVDLKALRQHGATNAQEQCNYLVELGFAYYMENRTTGINKRTGLPETYYAKRCNASERRTPPRIAIGEATQYTDVRFFFEMKAKSIETVDIIGASAEDAKALSVEFKEKLNRYMDGFDTLCIQRRQPNRPIEIENLMSDIHRQAQMHKLTAKNLLLYIECIRCIVYGELSISPPETFGVKIQGTATKVLGRMPNNIQMLEMVVYFVENLHLLGDGCKEATIFTLSFNFNKIKTMLYGKANVKRKSEDFDNDRL